MNITLFKDLSDLEKDLMIEECNRLFSEVNKIKWNIVK